MFRIGEFSKLAQVSIRMLRYYDETGLLKPAEIDKFTGYRLYSTDQIPILNKIVFLRDVGFNLTEIALALENWDDESILLKLKNKKSEIEDNIKIEQEKMSKIELAKKDIHTKKQSTYYNVTIKNIPSYQVLSLRRVIPNYYVEEVLWNDLSSFADKSNISICSNTFSIYHDTEYKETDVDVEICAPVTKFEKNSGNFTFRYTEPVPIMACTMVYGAFKNIAGAYLSFANWLQENNQYKMIGQNRQIVHRGPWNEDNPDKYLTEIQIPLEKLL